MLLKEKRSRQRMTGVHPELVAVVDRAAQLCALDFIVIEGVRSPERQEELFKKGLSKTKNSRHLTGHAVDLAPIVGGEIPWHDLEKFKELNDAMQKAAAEQDVPVLWGGNFKGFFDGVHFELDRKNYP